MISKIIKRAAAGQCSLPESRFASKISKSVTLNSSSLMWVGMAQHKTAEQNLTSALV